MGINLKLSMSALTWFWNILYHFSQIYTLFSLRIIFLFAKIMHFSEKCPSLNLNFQFSSFSWIFFDFNSNFSFPPSIRTWNIMKKCILLETKSYFDKRIMQRTVAYFAKYEIKYGENNICEFEIRRRRLFPGSAINCRHLKGWISNSNEICIASRRSVGCGEKAIQKLIVYR